MSAYGNQNGQSKESGGGNRPSKRGETESPSKKRYSPPLLAHEEHLRDITLAPSPFVSESGWPDGFGPEGSSSPVQSGSTDNEVFKNFFDNE